MHVHAYLLCIFAGHLEAAKRNLECVTPGLVTSPDVAEKHFASEVQKGKVKSPIGSKRSVPVDSVTPPKHTGLQRFQARIVRFLFI